MLRFITSPRLRFGLLTKSISQRRLLPTPSTRVALQPHTRRLHQFRRRNEIPWPEWSTILTVAWAIGPLLSLYVSGRFLANASEENYLLLSLIRLQRLDADFYSYDLNKDDHLLTYFDKVISCLTPNSPSQEVARAAKIIKDNSKQQNYALLRDFLVEVHDIIYQNKLQEPADTSRKVLGALGRLARGLGNWAPDNDT